MRKRWGVIVIGLALSACQLDPLAGIGGPPAVGFRTELVGECGAKLSRAGKETFDTCNTLGACFLRQSRETLLSADSAARVFRKIVPLAPVVTGQPRRAYTPMSEMSENAEQAGPQAVAMLSLYFEIRQSCLAETGLQGIVTDD